MFWSPLFSQKQPLFLALFLQETFKAENLHSPSELTGIPLERGEFLKATLWQHFH